MADHPFNIFVSHTVADKPIADAIKDAVEKLFGSYVTVSYSSDTERGPQAGENWAQWIDDQVKKSEFAFVLLTPSSLQKPWILWEAGAMAATAVVAGNAIVAGKAAARKVRPLLFRIPPEQVPDPFKNIQLVLGDNHAAMSNLLLELMDVMPGRESAKAGTKLAATLETYLNSIEEALNNAPLVPTEAVVQEWSLRLDDLKAQNRMSEVKSLHDWLNIAFGRDREDRPLDVRLHRRLGELYINAEDYEQAAIQFELARQASPRDIMTLRELGRAYMGKKRPEKAKEAIDAIEKLDPTAFERNVECAALKGRWLRKSDPAAAREVYRKAFQQNPKSYYAGDLLGQMELQLEDLESAKRTYRQVLEIINTLGESNLWVQATAANAAIVACAESSVVRKKLEEIRKFSPSPENLRTIEDGLRRIQMALHTDETVFKEWIAVLRQ